jgi:hypothetical protein
MGTFLFNLHLRTTDRDAVGGALSTVRNAFPAFVSDPQNGWVSVYTAEGTNCAAVARTVSEVLVCVAVSFAVYDSDGCHAVVYNAGKRVARRVTGPEEEAPERGDAGRFAKYAQASVTELRRILADDPVFAEETVFALGAAFGVPRTRVAFSYRWAPPTDAPPGLVHVAG